MITIGIDPSINSTGICVRTSDTYKYYIICSKMSGKMKSFTHNKISIVDYSKKPFTGLEYSDKEYVKSENIYKIIGVIGDILDQYIQGKYLESNNLHTGVSDEPDKSSGEIIVNMEGISYGSAGSAALVDLAGLNFAIRMLLLEKGIKFRIVSPMSLKVFATNNAGASKEEMSWAWKLLDREMNDIDKIKIDDLADAYFLCRYE